MLGPVLAPLAEAVRDMMHAGGGPSSGPVQHSSKVAADVASAASEAAFGSLSRRLHQHAQRHGVCVRRARACAATQHPRGR